MIVLQILCAPFPSEMVLEVLYSQRACWICGIRGMCEHREPEIDIAEIEARQRVMNRIGGIDGRN
jgi:hypothetical protein